PVAPSDGSTSTSTISPSRSRFLRSLSAIAWGSSTYSPLNCLHTTDRLVNTFSEIEPSSDTFWYGVTSTRTFWSSIVSGVLVASLLASVSLHHIRYFNSSANGSPSGCARMFTYQLPFSACFASRLMIAHFIVVSAVCPSAVVLHCNRLPLQLLD